MRTQQASPDAAYIDIGTIKALLSEKGAERPSDFECAARVFLLTLVGKYAPPEDLPEDATDQERVKYRWGHQGMDFYNRRMKYESKTVDPKKVINGQRANLVRRFKKQGLSIEEARKKAWDLIPPYDEEETNFLDSVADAEVSGQTPPIEVETEKKPPKAKASAPKKPVANPPPEDDVAEVLPEQAPQTRLQKVDAANLAKWKKMFPDADALRKYILEQIGPRLNSMNAKAVRHDPHCAEDVFNKLNGCGWVSTKTGRVFSQLHEVVPWLIQSYRESIASQNRGEQQIAQKENELAVASAEEMSHDDIETIRARRRAAAEKASEEWRKSHGAK